MAPVGFGCVAFCGWGDRSLSPMAWRCSLSCSPSPPRRQGLGPRPRSVLGPRLGPGWRLPSWRCFASPGWGSRIKPLTTGRRRRRARMCGSVAACVRCRAVCFPELARPLPATRGTGGAPMRPCRSAMRRSLPFLACFRRSVRRQQAEDTVQAVVRCPGDHRPGLSRSRAMR